MKKLMFLFSALVLLFSAATVRSDVERWINEVMGEGFADVSDLGLRRNPLSDPYRLGVVDEVLEEPTAVFDVGEEMRRTLENNDPLETVRLMEKYLDCDGKGSGEVVVDPDAHYFAASLLDGGDAGVNVPPSFDFWKVLQRHEEDDFCPLYKEGELVLEEALRVARKETKWEDLWKGREVCVGTEESDVYEERCDVIIDPGGDDVYRGEAGFTPVIIDFGGDDRYEATLPFSFGCGVNSTALLVDVWGNDTYRGNDFSFGCAVFGNGFLLDLDGDDVYINGSFGLGAAVFGLALLYDGGGNDTYRSAEYSQGFSQTRGGGVLQDAGGNDVYYAGGEVLHEPLYSDAYRSLSQGFSIGFRPRYSGGFALLYDGGGNDFYDAEVYAQGTSYWYSFGALIDENGRDYYSALIYGQGSGVHLSVGYLYDGGGEDSFQLLHGVGQGGAHDLSVSVLYDAGDGKDSYVGTGITRGTSHANGFGVFVDEGGNDIYAGRADEYQNGFSTRDRYFPGFGVFLDLGGVDSYSPNGEDGGAWRDGWVGFGADLENEPRERTSPEERTGTSAGPRRTEPPSPEEVESLFEEGSLWEVGTNRDRVKRARERLLAGGVEVFRRLVKEHLAGASTLQLRCFAYLASHLGAEAGRVLVEEMRENNEREVLLLLPKAARTYEEASKCGMTEEKWMSLLTGPNSALALEVLGNYGDRRAEPLVESVRERAETSDDLYFITFVRSLGGVCGSEGVKTLCSYLSREDFSAVRKYGVVDGLARALRRGGRVRREVWRALEEADSPAESFFLLESLARSPSPDEKRKFFALAEDRSLDPRVRSAAVEGLARILKERGENSDFVRVFRMALSESDPLVRHELKWILAQALGDVRFKTPPDY